MVLGSDAAANTGCAINSTRATWRAIKPIIGEYPEISASMRACSMEKGLLERFYGYSDGDRTRLRAL